MACGIATIGRTVTSAALVLLLVLELSLQSSAAPAKKNDILAGTEFLSVFINGAMAPRPPRRRPTFRRPVPTPFADSATAESRHDEASIFRISRAPSSQVSMVQSSRPSEEVTRFYPVSQKSLSSRPNLTSFRDPKPAKEPSPKPQIQGQHNKTQKMFNQKVIGVSVTSTVEATPYKVRVEHHDIERIPKVMMSSTATSTSSSTSTSSRVEHHTMVATSTATPPSHFTPPPAQLVTEELTNIVSESNRSEFSVDEGLPKTSWRERIPVTPRPTTRSVMVPERNIAEDVAADSAASGSSSDPVEQSYDPSGRNPGKEILREEVVHRGRKAGRHYDESVSYIEKNAYNDPSKLYPHQNLPLHLQSKPARNYGEPSKVYGESEKVYGEPAKVYGEPSKVYSEPAKVYSEPAKVYSEPAKVYSEPEKVYSEPSKVYSVPAKVYSEPAKIYSEPSKVYGLDGQPIEREPVEQNYEVDEAVSIGSNGNAHGPQVYTDPPVTTTQDSTKVSYVEEGRNYRKYRVEERTPDGFIVGEYGVVSHDDGSLRGVRYTADGTINPKLIYDALMKFLAL